MKGIAFVVLFLVSSSIAMSQADSLSRKEEILREYRALIGSLDSAANNFLVASDTGFADLVTSISRDGVVEDFEEDEVRFFLRTTILSEEIYNFNFGLLSFPMALRVDLTRFWLRIATNEFLEERDKERLQLLVENARKED